MKNKTTTTTAGRATTTTTAVTAPRPTAPPVHFCTDNPADLRVVPTTDKASYAVGDRITIMVTVTNVSTIQCAMPFGDAKHYAQAVQVNPDGVRHGRRRPHGATRSTPPSPAGSTPSPSIRNSKTDRTVWISTRATTPVSTPHLTRKVPRCRWAATRSPAASCPWVLATGRSYITAPSTFVTIGS